MSALFDLVPHIRITGTVANPANNDGQYVQPLDSVVDLSEFTDLAVIVNISEFSGDTNTIKLEL